MVAPVDTETLIGRTRQGDTVLLVPGTKVLLLTPAGVVALIHALAASQGLTVAIDGACACPSACPHAWPFRFHRSMAQVIDDERVPAQRRARRVKATR